MNLAILRRGGERTVNATVFGSNSGTERLNYHEGLDDLRMDVRRDAGVLLGRAWALSGSVTCVVILGATSDSELGR